MSDTLERFLAHGGDARVAVVDDSGTSSYADLVRRARSVSAALRSRNAGASLEGERIAIFVHPSADFLAAFFGVLLAGGCVLVLSPLHPLPETRYLCEDAGARRVIVSAPLRAAIESLADVVALEDVASLAAARAHAPDLGRASPRHAALQVYTSGTTGKPKGAILTHTNLDVQQREVGAAWGFVENDRLLHALPLHHVHGLQIALLTALGAGATSRMTTFDARAIWEEMARATVFMGVPAMYHRLFVAFDAASDTERARWAANAGALRLATSGSAALPVGLAARWKELTGVIPLERFGMTEIGVGITNPLDPAERHAGLVGQPLPTVEARIVGDDGNDAEVGELWIRGPSVFAGYHGRAADTAKAFTDDWFHTGDTVTCERALPGAPFRILGRTSVDILKSGGYKLSALEIEEVLRAHSAVAEAAVVGVPDEAWGDRVVACIVTRPSIECDAADLRAFVRERLAAYKVPKDVVFFREFPKTALGKVMKPDLVKRLGERDT